MSVENLLDLARARGVMIATPAETHFSVASQALRAPVPP